MEHPVLAAIGRAGFAALGWFAPEPRDGLPPETRFVILIGNAGPAMFRRFARERDPFHDLIDDWTRVVVGELARDLDASAIYPFDRPYPPILTWARRGGAGHVSPLGLNIHPTYGLWHAYRAALAFPVAFDLPEPAASAHPCASCKDKPCLTACPVSAFDGSGYDVASCGRHLLTASGAPCMQGGCLARLACPVGVAHAYGMEQMQYFMRAFQAARRRELQQHTHG